METVTKETQTKNKLTLEQHAARLLMKNGDLQNASVSLSLDRQKGNRAPNFLWNRLLSLAMKRGRWDIILKIREDSGYNISEKDAVTCARVAFKNYDILNAIPAYKYAQESISLKKFQVRVEKAFSLGKLSPKGYRNACKLLELEPDPVCLRFSLTRIIEAHDLTAYLELCAILDKKPAPEIMKECIEYQSIHLPAQEFLSRMSMFMIVPSKKVLIKAAEHAFANGNPRDGRQFLSHAYPFNS